MPSHARLACALAALTFLVTGGNVAAADPPAKIAAAVDELVDRPLKLANIPASPAADDAEFLRRATLDITGRIPTLDEARCFLASDEPQRRDALIDALLNKQAYGQHFAIIWKELIYPRDLGLAKSGADPFTPWLADAFNRNRGWDEIVTDMLTAEGNLRETPASGFISANSENFDPQPNLLADATARLFWGVQLRCAECHDHPFASWKQADLWSTAAFFSRLRRGYTQGKNPAGWTLTEAAPDEPVSKQFGVSWVAQDVAGPAILVPTTGGKLAGKAVRARFLAGDEAPWTDEGPYRARFARWATSAENRLFARNAVNRMWAHFFGRGLIHPLDEFHEGNPPTHPEVLDLLADELIAADYDLKHLIRVICCTQAYGRTSRPVRGNETDAKLLSHMAVKPMRPEMLHDALSIVLVLVLPKPGSKPGAKQPTENLQPLPGVARDEFIRFFGVRPGESESTVVNQGILQALRMMNGPLLNSDTPVLARLAKSRAAPEEAIESLYLAAYARPPRPTELQGMTLFVTKHAAADDAYLGILWALLNSSEFVLNH